MLELIFVNDHSEDNTLQLLLNEKEVPLRGIIKYVDKQLDNIDKEDLVGFELNLTNPSIV